MKRRGRKVSPPEVYVAAAAPSISTSAGGHWEKSLHQFWLWNSFFYFFFFFAISTVPDQATHCLMTLVTIFVVVYLSPGHHGSDRRANFQNPCCKENIWPATAKCGTSSPPCEFCHLNPAVPLHVRRPVLSHHPQPSTPPPPPPSSPTHLMWHFVARAEAAVSTVILIFK